MKSIIKFISRERKIIFLIIIWKIAVISIAFLAISLLPFNETVFRSNFVYPKNQKITLFSSLKTWDAQHFLYLSEVGYKPDQISNGFYPLYPLTIKILTFITRNSFLSAMILSNIYSTVALLLFYSFVKSLKGRDTAFYATVLFMMFPTGFYLNIIYSEALFIMLCVGFFYFLYRKNFILASLFAFLAPSARSIGLFIAVPFLVFLFLQHKKGKLMVIPTFNSPLEFRFHPEYLWLIFPFLGYALNFLYMYIVTGDPFAQYSAFQYFIGNYSVFNILNLPLFFQNLFGTSLVLHGLTNSILDRVFFVFFVLMIPVVYKKVDKTLFFFYLVLGFVPFFGSFVGYMRYLLPAFPLYMALGDIFSKEKHGVGFYSYIFISHSMQIFLLILYALSYWVS